MSHALVLTFLPPLLNRLGMHLNQPVTILIVAIFFAVGLDWLVVTPVERIRRRIAGKLPRAGEGGHGAHRPDNLLEPRMNADERR